MAKEATIALAIILAVVASSAIAEDYLLYKPQKARSAEIPLPGDAVLTKTIIIRKGDTLSGLSKKYSGRGSFFSQILLFNKIENPDLIIAGRSLKVPLTRKEVKAGRGEGARPAAVSKQSARRVDAVRSSRYFPVWGTDGKRLFNRGVSASMNGRYQEAIDLFDRYLAAYPNSPQAPDAALYRADCYMKLSIR